KDHQDQEKTADRGDNDSTLSELCPHKGITDNNRIENHQKGKGVDRQLFILSLFSRQENQGGEKREHKAKGGVPDKGTCQLLHQHIPGRLQNRLGVFHDITQNRDKHGDKAHAQDKKRDIPGQKSSSHFFFMQSQNDFPALFMDPFPEHHRQ